MKSHPKFNLFPILDTDIQNKIFSLLNTNDLITAKPFLSNELFKKIQFNTLYQAIKYKNNTNIDWLLSIGRIPLITDMECALEYNVMNVVDMFYQKALDESSMVENRRYQPWFMFGISYWTSKDYELAAKNKNLTKMKLIIFEFSNVVRIKTPQIFSKNTFHLGIIYLMRIRVDGIITSYEKILPCEFKDNKVRMALAGLKGNNSDAIKWMQDRHIIDNNTLVSTVDQCSIDMFRVMIKTLNLQVECTLFKKAVRCNKIEHIKFLVDNGHSFPDDILRDVLHLCNADTLKACLKFTPYLSPHTYFTAIYNENIEVLDILFDYNCVIPSDIITEIKRRIQPFTLEKIKYILNKSLLWFLAHGCI